LAGYVNQISSVGQYVCNIKLDKMKAIETEIIIPASKQQIWSVLMDHSSYPNWNPFIIHISGKSEVKQSLQVKINPKPNNTMGFTPIVLVNNLNQEFRWKGKLWLNGIFDGEHYFILESLNEKQTKLIHGEQFSGILTAPLFSLIGNNTKKGFETMNIALKEEVLKRIS
jgi:hypothetical protein